MSPSVLNQAVPQPNTTIPPAPSGDVSLSLVPDTVTVPLRPAHVSGRFARLHQTQYHPVTPRPGALVSLFNAALTPRRVRVWMEPTDRDRESLATTRTARWHYALRQPNDLMGGTSLPMQDAVSPEGDSLTLFLLPRERREAMLEFAATLDGDTAAPPGAYAFVVRIADADDPSGTPQQEAFGTVILQHPASDLLERLPGIYRDAMEEAEREENGVSPGADFSRFSRTGNFGTVGFTKQPFFVRFLRGFDDVLDILRGGADRLHLLFGADTTPPDFLPWLAQWVALSLDENWQPMRCRALIKEAVELYTWRGTKRGLTRFLQIYTGATPVITEKSTGGMRLGKETRMGDKETRLGNRFTQGAHTFRVSLTLPAHETQVREATIRAIIDTQKPAHTRYVLNVLGTVAPAETTSEGTRNAL